MSEYAASLEQRIVQKDKELREQDAKIEEQRKEIAKLQNRVQLVLDAFDAATIYDHEERQAWDRYATARVVGHTVEFSAELADDMLKERRERFGSPLAPRAKRPE
jgi:hypothetical protein